MVWASSRSITRRSSSLSKGCMESRYQVPASASPSAREWSNVMEAASGSNPRYSDLPILVFSSSSSPRERGRLEALGMARYFTKPADLEQYLELGKIVRELLAQTTNRTESRKP